MGIVAKVIQMGDDLGCITANNCPLSELCQKNVWMKLLMRTYYFLLDNYDTLKSELEDSDNLNSSHKCITL